MSSFAQDFDKQNIYYKALESHFGKREDLNRKRPDLWKIYDVYYIEKNDLIIKNFPDSIRNSKIELLSRSDIEEKTKKKQVINLFVVRPAQWKDGKLIINVIEFAVSRKRNNYSYVNTMDGTSYQVVYNSSNKEYALIPIK